MNTSALITMILVQVPVTIVTIYFFLKVLRTPPRAEPDSYIDNDDVPR
ncbi:MAG: hypothetical protein R2798_12525 [Chitinophagales bacterium]|nr:hypothetical protein [Bacteroidota bacterium]MCB9044410.1 hypothetical protein [Chitinophagales bacterium]